MMMIVYWYSFSNHYTRECIHTCDEQDYKVRLLRIKQARDKHLNYRSASTCSISPACSATLACRTCPARYQSTHLGKLVGEPATESADYYLDNLLELHLKGHVPQQLRVE